MNLAAIYDKYKDLGFDYTPGIIVGDIDRADVGPSLYIDKKYIASLDDKSKKCAHSKVLEYKKNPNLSVESIAFSFVQWDALRGILEKPVINDNFIDPVVYDVQNVAIINLPLKFSSLPSGFLICRNLIGALIFHEPDAINSDTQSFYDDLYDHLSREYKNVEILSVKKNVTDVLKERILSNNNDYESDINSDAKRKLLEILTDAVQGKVSDIHIYLLKNGKSYYQYRIFKRLQAPIRIGSEMLESVLRSAWRAEGSKVSDLFSNNSSQDRTLQLSIQENESDYGVYKFRFQSSPIEGGLKVVMRVINTDNTGLGQVSFHDFGYEDYQEHQIRMSLNVHDGLLLVAGATNSGKSTAISKMLIELVKLRPYWAIDSVEDPVENELEGVAQHPVSLSNIDNTGLNEKDARNQAFLRALMDLMRQDPDVINVGEIRDKISAETCRDFVNTGHKLFTTIHAKRIMGCYGRLTEIGMNNDDLCRKGFLTAIIYQSLIPTVCGECSTSHVEFKENHSLKYSALSKLIPSLENIKIHNPKGCPKCRGGIKGLTVCAEILEPDTKFSQFIRDNDFHGAENYWLHGAPYDNEQFEYKGRSIEDAIIFKVFKGVICPLIAEEYLSPLEYLGRSYSSKTLFPSQPSLKSVSDA